MSTPYDFNEQDRKTSPACPEQKTPGQTNTETNPENRDGMQRVLDMLLKQPPSQRFASGAVFDLVRQHHRKFEEIIHSGNVLQLWKFFTEAYIFFCRNPQSVGFLPLNVTKENIDTDPRKWNADLFTLEHDCAAALCFIPITSDVYLARIIGIITGSKGDGYYYCMLKKDVNAFSDVIRNMASPCVFPTVGTVKGRGFELMNSFLECIKADYYQSPGTPYPTDN